MSSLQDVARLAEVSVTTASKILNTRRDLERFTPACIARVHEAARQVSYVPNFHAQRLREGKSYVVGVPLETVYDDALGDAYFSKLLNGVRFALAQAGYAMCVFSSTEERSATTQCLQQLRQGGLDGMVVPGVLSRLDGRVWSDTGALPVVMVEPKAPMPFPCVDLDFRAGIRAALTHLAELGHRRILWLGPTKGPRYQEFASTAWQHGFQGASCSLEFEDGKPADQEGDARQSCHALRAYLAAGEADFSAVVCFNDAVAAGAVRALRECGRRVPDDVSVVGFDDYSAGVLDPPLTTVSHRLYDMGHRAAEILLEMLAAPEKFEGEPLVDVMEPALVIRDSTSRAADSR